MPYHVPPAHASGRRVKRGPGLTFGLGHGKLCSKLDSRSIVHLYASMRKGVLQWLPCYG